MKKVFILASALGLSTISAWADVVCTGIVVDENDEPLIGVIVATEDESVKVLTDIDGRFKITVPDKAKSLTFSSKFYKPMTLKVAPDMGVVAMDVAKNMLQDVVVTQSIARTRMTPVAMSNVDAAMIETKLGGQEFPEVLKTTPGVWATKEGGGYGDAKINMRGFKSPNVAVLINGVPVNDMEWGGVYWSNWAGLSDVTSSMQTHRGRLNPLGPLGGRHHQHCHPQPRRQKGRQRMVRHWQQRPQPVRCHRIDRTDGQRMGHNSPRQPQMGRRICTGHLVQRLQLLCQYL